MRSSRRCGMKNTMFLSCFQFYVLLYCVTVEPLVKRPPWWKTTFHHHHHLSLNLVGRWGTTDDFATSFLHLPCSWLPSGTWQTLGLSNTWCSLPTSSSVCLVFFLLSLCLARWFRPHIMNGRHDHTTAVCISLQCCNGQEVFVWSNCLLDLGTDFLVGNMVFVWDM